jgi:hypothetical protein
MLGVTSVLQFPIEILVGADQQLYITGSDARLFRIVKAALRNLDFTVLETVHQAMFARDLA